MLRYLMATPLATTLEKDKEERVLHIAAQRHLRTRIIQIVKGIRAIIKFTHRVTTGKAVDIIARMVHQQVWHQQTSLHHKNMVIVVKFIQTRIERYTNHQEVINFKMLSTPPIK